MLIKDFSFEPILIDSRFFRKGILLAIRNQNNEVATAEISPLPGHSHETLDDALEQLQSLKRRILTTWWTNQALPYLETWDLYPSVHFGVKSALLDLLDPVENAPKSPMYALLLGTPDEIIQRSKDAKEEGFKEAKVKLGHFSPEIAKDVVDQLSEDFKLRLDLNRRWTLDESISLCRHYPQDHFNYLEEPCSNPEDLHHFPYPFALDETLTDHYDLAPFLQLDQLKALIIKPTLLSPIDPFLNLGKQVVITSSFEGPLGITQLKRLILRLGLQNTLHGLDTLRYMDEEVDHGRMSNRLLEKASS